MAAYDACLAHIPDNAGCLNAKCAALLATGSPESAHATCGQAHTLHPLNPTSLYHWGVVQMNRGQYGESISLLQKSYGMDPNNTKALSDLCYALSRGGYCEWCLGNLTLLLEVSNTSSSYLSSGAYRSYCLLNDTTAIQHKWTAIHQYIEEINNRASSLEELETCKEWKLERSYSYYFRMPISLPEMRYESDYVNVLPEGAQLDESVSVISEDKSIFIGPIHNVSMEGLSEVIFQGFPKCVVFVNDHLWESRIGEWSGLPRPVVKVNERVALAFQYDVGNKYQFMVEAFGRMALIKKYVSSIAAIVKILIPMNDQIRDQMLQIIDIFKLKKHEYIEMEFQQNVTYDFISLWLVDWRSKEIEAVRDPWSVYYPPASVIQFTSKTVLESVGLYRITPNTKDWKLLYVTHNDSQRTFENESLLINALTSNFQDHVHLFNGNSQSYIDQMRTFREASIIISTHGSSLANLMWAMKGTDLILFPLEPHVDQGIMKVCGVMGVKVSVVVDVSAYYFGHYHIDQQKVDLIVNEVNKILKRKHLNIKEDLK
eukprot:TRINITY_DN9017_c0_g1_i1.p1 TRINITY_DN9017_c0_g1~~TRINITY_DN9017_c0_g1_i1.p1  ORF type:complete len:624 (-),score=138.56 TRINITY_DN9017_c0_g1_i1:53-1681(-)